MESAISQLSYLPETRQQIQSFVRSAKAEILDGQWSAQELLYKKKMIDETLKQLFDDNEVKKYLMDEVEKFGKEGIGYQDAKIEIKSKRTFDFSKCGDSNYEKSKSEFDTLKKQISEREKFLKMLQKPIADPESGEMIQPPSFTTTDYFNVTLAK